MKEIKEYQDEDWGKLKKKLKKKYRADNITQQINTKQFLETLMDKPRGVKNAANYYRQYATISRKLKTAGRLDEYTQYQLFVRDLPDETRKKIFLHYHIDPDGETAPQFKKILKMATNITVSERRIQKFIKKRENDKISELINKYDKKLLTVKEKKYTIPVVKTAVGASSTPSNQAVIKKRIKNLTQYISALTLTTRAIINKQQRIPRQRNNQEFQRRKNTPPPNEYFYYEDPHFMSTEHYAPLRDNITN